MLLLRLGALLLLFAGISALLTWGLARLKPRILKYVPALAALLIGLYQWLNAAFGKAEGMRDLAGLLTSWLMFAAAVGGLCAAFVLDGVFSRRRK